MLSETKASASDIKMSGGSADQSVRPAGRNRHGVRIRVTVYRGESFGKLIRKYAFDRMGRDRQYRHAVVERQRQRKEAKG